MCQGKWKQPFLFLAILPALDTKEEKIKLRIAFFECSETPTYSEIDWSSAWSKKKKNGINSLSC